MRVSRVLAWSADSEISGLVAPVDDHGDGMKGEQLGMVMMVVMEECPREEEGNFIPGGSVFGLIVIFNLGPRGGAQ